MDWKCLITVFISIFIAELGDKTQLATLGFAMKFRKPFTVFLGSALAVALSSAIAALIGTGMGKMIPTYLISRISGSIFVIIGILLIWGKF